MSEVLHPMRLVAQRTGLSPHVVRVWERRYGAVVPERTETNRRLYSEGEIRRLELMARLTEAGHSISQIAGLPTDELRAMAAALPSRVAAPVPRAAPGPADNLLEEAWSCVLDLDSAALRTVLDKAAVSLGLSKLAERLIVPLAERIGSAWESGEISVAEEHAASAVIKEVLFMASRPFAESTGAPNLAVTTPTGQLHELGAVLATCAARQHGWDVTYLGPSLPAAEIARAAIRNQSLAVGLSIVYPGDDPQLPDELRCIRRYLPDQIVILIGGRAAHCYESVTREIGAEVITDLTEFTAILSGLRAGRHA